MLLKILNFIFNIYPIIVIFIFLFLYKRTSTKNIILVLTLILSTYLAFLCYPLFIFSENNIIYCLNLKSNLNLFLFFVLFPLVTLLITLLLYSKFKTYNKLYFIILLIPIFYTTFIYITCYPIF